MSEGLSEADLTRVLRAYLSGEMSLSAINESTGRWDWSLENIHTPLGQAMGAVELVIHEVGDGAETELGAHQRLFAVLETLRGAPLTATVTTAGSQGMTWTLDRR